MVTRTDQDLLTRWIENQDAEAFRHLSLRHSAMVYATCRRVLRDPSEAEDVSQECLRALAFNLKEPIKHLGGWLHRVATNLALKRARSERRRKERETIFATAREPALNAPWDDLQEHVDRALAQLPEELREPLVLHFLENRTHKDIARTMGVARSTVTHRVQKGVESLRKNLKEQGVLVGVTVLAAFLEEHLTAQTVPATLQAAIGKLALAGSGRPRPAITGVPRKIGGTSVMYFTTGTAFLIVAGLTLWQLTPEPPREVAGTPPVASPPARPAPTAKEAPVRAGGVPGDGVVRRPEASVDQPFVLSAITGRLYKTESDEPISGVEVWLGARSDGFGKVVRTTTDPEGNYRFEGLTEDVYRVRRSAVNPGLPGAREEEAVLVALREGQHQEVNLPVRMGIRVAGTVVDAQGRPVSGANVEGRDRNDNRSLEIYTTNSDGTFELFGFRPTQALTIEADVKDQQASELHGPLELDDEGILDLVVSLHPAASISGTVVDSQGRPWVGLLVNPSPSTKLQRTTGRGQDRTDSSGAFEVRGLAAESYTTLLLPKGASSYKKPSPPWTEFTVLPGQEVDGVTIVLDREQGRSISGQITNTAGEPIDEARITVRGARSWSHASSDAGGFYKAVDLDEELLSVTVAHERYATTRRKGVAAGTKNADFTLRERGAVEGRILDANSKEPIPRFEILYVDDHNRNHVGVERDFRKQADAEGGFRLEEVEPGRVTVIARAPGYGERSVDIPRVKVGETVEGVVIALSHAGSIEGQVLDTAGVPVEGARILLGDVPQHEAPDLVAAARTGQDGGFLLTKVSTRVKRVSVYHPGYATTSSPVELSAGGHARVTLVLPSGGVVTGSVLRAGRPCADHRVFLHMGGKPGGRRLETQTGPTGHYRLERVDPGPCTLFVMDRSSEGPTRREYHRTLGVLDGATHTIDVEFRSGSAALKGLVTVRGEPAPNATASLLFESPSNRELRSAEVDPDGRYHFDELPEGLASLVVNADEEKFTRRVDVQIEKGQSLVRDVEFWAGISVSGNVSGLRTDEFAAVFAVPGDVAVTKKMSAVELQDALATTVARALVQADGPYELSGLAAGQHSIIAFTSTRNATDFEKAMKDSRFVKKLTDVQAPGPQVDIVFDG